jgi:Protein of unknown function (DUF2752)
MRGIHLDSFAGEAIVPDQEPELPIARPVRRRSEYVPHNEQIGKVARAFLGIMACGFLVVFVIAAWLHPYDADGLPKSMATHTQLGMPPCNMVVMYGKPCPSCGMTTSFSLLVHGDVWNSLKANWVGTLMAIFWMGLIPWGFYGTIRGRLLWVRNGELFLTFSVGAILVLMVLRWAWVLLF